jgi:hypothetical protein
MMKIKISRSQWESIGKKAGWDNNITSQAQSHDDEILIYGFDPHEVDHFENICKQLYGDGTTLDPDTRRDMANKMRHILNNKQPFTRKDFI